MSILVNLRRLAAAAAAVVIGLSLVAFTLPIPAPTVSPTAPAPLPSIATTVKNMLSPPTNNGAPAGNQVAPVGEQRPSSTVPSGAGASVSADAPQAAGAGSRTSAADKGSAASGGIGRGGQQTAALASTGSGPGGAGPSLPLAPAVLAGLVLLLGFFGLRMNASTSIAARRFRLRVDASPLAPGAPAGAASAALIRLLESSLPAGFALRSCGDGSVLVEAPVLHRALLFSRLTEIGARSERVGLRLEWRNESAARGTLPRLRLAAG